LISKDYWGYTDIVDLKPLVVFGKIRKTSSDELSLELSVKGVMVLKDARTLEPTDYPYFLEIKEIIKENEQIKQNILDIEPILWENVLLEVPTRIVSDESPMHLKGEGWEIKDN
jgi:uncharacterized protein